MAELAVENLSLRFGGLVVLDSVSFGIEPGELFALIGPNGAGKTSVLNCISGIYRGEGRIVFRGSDIAGRPPHEIARLGLARTFQHGELFMHMTVLENKCCGATVAEHDLVALGQGEERGEAVAHTANEVAHGSLAVGGAHQ